MPCSSRMNSSSSLSSADLARIEAGGRLVEAEQHRLGAHGARDLQAPLGAVGQVAGRIVRAVDEPDALEPVRRAFSIAAASARR